MHWRRLRPDELDHELIWFCVTVVSALLAIVWLKSGVPTPRCVWHDLTGIPCLGCGATRCVKHLLHGAWPAAFSMNPLAFLSLMGVAIYDGYAAVVLFGRLPRLRFREEEWPSWAGWTIRGGVVALLLANWAWLVAHHV